MAGKVRYAVLQHQWRVLLIIICCLLFTPAAFAEDDNATAVPIFVYHRFGHEVADSMTTRTKIFEEQLAYLRANNYHIIPLAKVLAWREGLADIPEKSVVITVDDGHNTVYSELLPIIKKYQIPVTLFIYPSAISNAKYALTWAQLQELIATGLFSVQSHTYWHPNFKTEKKRLDPAVYAIFVKEQLFKSKEVLSQRLHEPITLLAWPFGIVNDELQQAAKDNGYQAAFALENSSVTKSSPIYALPRYLMIDAYHGKSFIRLLQQAGDKSP